MEDKQKHIHSLSLNNREYLEMDGINEVISFTDDEIILKTSQGVLNINGKNLNISKLNLDETVIEVSGKIDSFNYNDKTNNKNFLKRIFK